MTLDPAAALLAITELTDRLGFGVNEAAEGVLTILNANMAKAMN